MSIRVKCPQCGKIVDTAPGAACPDCGTVLNEQGGKMYFYRMGSPLGVAVGMGVYLNNQPYGHVANKQTVCYSLPYGTYNLHVTHSMNRKCTDLTIVLDEQHPEVFVKGHIKMGFISNTIVLEFCQPQDMPH